MDCCSRSSDRGALGALEIIVTVIVVALASAPLAAYAPPGRTQRVSVAADGAQGDGFSNAVALSANGRWAAFTSGSTNLVAGDTNDRADVFAKDRTTGAVERVSVASDGTQGNQISGWDDLAISSDGRIVAFVSSATNLVPGGASAGDQLFVRDRSTGTTEQVSVASNGGPANAYSDSPTMSADGRFVAFTSAASSLVAGDTNGALDIFVHDRAIGSTERVSVASDGTPSDADSWYPAMSADGRFVAFQSQATTFDDVVQLNGAFVGPYFNVFIHDRQTHTTERVSIGSSGSLADGSSWEPQLSADGRFVAFRSTASNLVPADANGTWDIFVRDRLAGTTERVSLALGSSGEVSNGLSAEPYISADGRYVTFESEGNNLIAGDTNGQRDIFLYDRWTGAMEQLSVASDGVQSNGTSGYNKSISAGGRLIAFRSGGSNLVPGDTNGAEDSFLRDPGPGTGVGEVEAVAAGGVISVGGWARFGGQTIADAVDLPGDAAPPGGALGGEIIGASVIYRPELRDVLVRLRVASLPSAGVPTELRMIDGIEVGGRVPSVAAAPDVVHGLRFRVGAERYEVRALRLASEDLPSTAPHLGLYHCAPACVKVAPLDGGYGTAGNEVRFTLQLGTAGLAEGALLADLVAFTATHDPFNPEPSNAALLPLDDLSLPDATLPLSRVELGLALASVSEALVDYSVSASLSSGVFSGQLSTTSLAGGDYRVWARGCVGAVCGPAAAPGVIPVTGTAGGALSFYSLSPCRIMDTRDLATPLEGGSARTLALAGACGVPATARAVSVNATAVSPAAAGTLLFYPAAPPPPLSSSISFAAGQTRANNAVVGLAADGTTQAMATLEAAGGLDLVVDVNGWFE